MVADHELPKKVEYHSFSILDSEKLKDLFNQIQPDIVINLAAVSSVGKSWEIPQETVLTYVIGALNVLEAARALEKNPAILLIGSSEEYAPTQDLIHEGSPLNANNPYGISKVMQENFARLYRQRYEMKVFCVRTFNHTGVGQTDTFVLPSFCKQVAEIE